MYDYIKGTLEELSPAEAVVECHGMRNSRPRRQW